MLRIEPVPALRPCASEGILPLFPQEGMEGLCSRNPPLPLPSPQETFSPSQPFPPAPQGHQSFLLGTSMSAEFLLMALSSPGQPAP